MLLCRLVELGLVMGGGQSLGKLLKYWRESVIRLISRGPKSVTTSVFGELRDLQDSIVGWDSFESDAIGRSVRDLLGPNTVVQLTRHATRHSPNVSSLLCIDLRNTGGFAASVNTSCDSAIQARTSDEMMETSSSTLPCSSTLNPRLEFNRA